MAADHRDVLAAAVAGIHGSERPGQTEMADAIAAAFESGEHLLVQAGTGTGKSLGYLAPTLIGLANGSLDRVVIATATLALQAQLANNDIPAALDAVEQVTGKRPVHAILKGRTNYACLLRVRDGTGGEQEALISASDLAATVRSAPAADPESVLGAEVLLLREWAEEQARSDGLADRDDAPSHTDRGWAQVSIPVRECLSPQRCPYGSECFVEASRDAARVADLVVTNHALLAINAMHGQTALPEHDAVVIDEAHELAARVTGAASGELTPGQVDRVAKRATAYLEDEIGVAFLQSADVLRDALDEGEPGRIEDSAHGVLEACRRVRDTARAAVSAMGGGGEKPEPEQRQAASAVQEIFDLAERVAALDDRDVVWVAERERFGREVRVAPLSVAGLMRHQVFEQRTTVLTSATLKLGGDFAGLAGGIGLRPAEQVTADTGPDTSKPADSVRRRADADAAALGGDGDSPVPWRGIDVGSPFDYRRQAICYVARSLPPPSRDGMSEVVLAEIAELVWAAGGRTLGLFSSRRAAEAAAVHVRRQLPSLTVLCQGDAQLSELTRRFVAEEATSLFGTLSLWQGVDVPGATCQLVIIDRIPFPRPDEPLTLARQRAVAESGGNGFMAVAATHAALLLAQGAGRLIRRTSDRGVVAVLDSRLMTARYGSFLRASMPGMWVTTDREVTVGALRRLNSGGGAGQ